MSNTKKHSEYAEQALENIFSAIDQIHLGNLTIVTGDNGTGKSLIRKVVASHLTRENNGNLVKVASTSMERRTGLHSEMGGMGVFMRDAEEDATSYSSLYFLEGLLKSTKDRYVVIDEPEIGMSQNLQFSVGDWLVKKLPEVLGNNKGVMVITHSKEIVRQLSKLEHVFINIQKKDEETWLNEEPSLIDLDDFKNKHLELYRIISDHLKD